MTKKVTMKEIARLANVSIATVSYVLNNVSNQTIPDKTRCLILQIAKDLHYIPNLAARSLKKKTGLVGILVNRETAPPFWRQQSHLYFISQLEQMLTAAGYHTLLYTLDAANPSLEIVEERKLEAVFLLDVKDEFFYSISSRFAEGVPLIVVDSLIEDRLFNQITYDYSEAVRLAETMLGSLDYTLIIERYNNKALLNYVQDAASGLESSVYVVDDTAALDSLLRNPPHRQVIAGNELIGNYVERSAPTLDVVSLCTCNFPHILPAPSRKIVFEDNKAQTAFRLMESLLDSSYEFSGNQFLIRPIQPEA